MSKSRVRPLTQRSLRRARARRRMINQARNRRETVKRRVDDEYGRVIQRMTNRQRQKWIHAERPGHKKRDAEPLYAFVPRGHA